MQAKSFLAIITPFFEYFDSGSVASNKLAMRAWYRGLSSLSESQLIAALERAIAGCDRKYLPSPNRVLDLFLREGDDIAGIEQWKIVIQAIAASTGDRPSILGQLDPASDSALSAMGGVRHLAENVKPEFLHSLEQKRFLELRGKYAKAIAIGQIKPSLKLEPQSRAKPSEVFEEAKYDPEIWEKMRANLERVIGLTK